MTSKRIDTFTTLQPFPHRVGRLSQNLATSSPHVEEIMSDERSSGQPAAENADYVTKGQESILVQNDDAPVEDPIDEAEADTDKQLGESTRCRASAKISVHC